MSGLVLSLWLLAHGPTWQQTFAGDGPVHYRASYVDAAGRQHQLEAWRDGDRLRRRTDGRLDLVVERRRDGELALQLHDPARGIVFRLTRSDLYRMGELTDWDGLAHALVRPRGQLAIAPGARSTGCRWWTVTSVAGDSQICWSRRFGLPVEIRVAAQRVFWLEQVDRRIPADAFLLPADARPIDLHEED